VDRPAEPIHGPAEPIHGVHLPEAGSTSPEAGSASPEAGSSLTAGEVAVAVSSPWSRHCPRRCWVCPARRHRPPRIHPTPALASAPPRRRAACARPSPRAHRADRRTTAARRSGLPPPHCALAQGHRRRGWGGGRQICEGEGEERWREGGREGTEATAMQGGVHSCRRE